MRKILPPRAKPTIALTCGDPAGIGPRLVLRALKKTKARFNPLLIGEYSVWKRAGSNSSLAPIIDTAVGAKMPKFGRPSAVSGQISFAAVKLAFRLANKGLIDGMVTAPISKLSWKMAGIGHHDHTEYFRANLPGCDVQMILGNLKRNLWCVTATRHISLSRVASELSQNKIKECARALYLALNSLHYNRPKIGLCGLNPHAGEEGMLGHEEMKILIPAAKKMRFHHPVHLFPADTAWRKHCLGQLDGLICLYHDQALIALKALCGLDVVNWTIGAPFVRVSPGHGTGFDIANHPAMINTEAMNSAMELAVRLSVS